MEKIRNCEICGKNFKTTTNALFCSDKCRKESKTIHRKKYAGTRYGDADFEALSKKKRFVSWEQRYNKADRMGKITLVTSACEMSYGYLSYLYDNDYDRYYECYLKALRHNQLEDFKKLEALKKEQEELARIIDERNAWKKDVVPLDERTGEEKCKDCKWFDPNKMNANYCYRCSCPVHENNPKGYPYKSPSSPICKKGFTRL